MDDELNEWEMPCPAAAGIPCGSDDCLSHGCVDEREPQTAAELADQWVAHYLRAIEDGTGNPDVCRDMIDRWLDHRIDHGNEPRLPL